MNTNSTEREDGEGVVERVVGEELYDALFVRSNRVAILLEPDGRVVDVNDAALALDDFDQAAVVGETLWETVLFSEKSARADIRCAATGKPVEVDWVIRGGSGATVLDVAIQPIAPGESVAFLLVTGVDVTDREQRVAALERQNARLEEFVRVVSHDLRTPLSVASAHLDLATERADLEELVRVERSLDRIDELLADAQSVASTGYAIEERTTVDLADLARSAWDHVETSDATLDVESTTTLSADETRLTQVFENLFANAPEHGSASPDPVATSFARPPWWGPGSVNAHLGPCEIQVCERRDQKRRHNENGPPERRYERQRKDPSDNAADYGEVQDCEAEIKGAPGDVVATDKFEIDVELRCGGAGLDDPLAVVELDDVHLVHAGEVDLLEGGVDALALVVGDGVRLDVVLPGGDLVGEFAERGSVFLLSETVQCVPAPVVAQQVERLVAGEITLLVLPVWRCCIRCYFLNSRCHSLTHSCPHPAGTGNCIMIPADRPTRRVDDSRGRLCVPGADTEKTAVTAA